MPSSDAIFNVVINEEDQYSIWPANRTLPAGWREIGERGSKEHCLSYIETVWTDMRPRSLRESRRGARGEGA